MAHNKNMESSCKNNKLSASVRILFDKNKHNPKERRFFNALFPVAERAFGLVMGEEIGSRFSAFRRFPIILQTIEAHIILDRILLRIDPEFPGQITVTIHEIIIAEDDQVKIERV